MKTAIIKRLKSQIEVWESMANHVRQRINLIDWASQDWAGRDKALEKELDRYNALIAKAREKLKAVDHGE